jgi:ABC-type antimicrobial peptide transport system permease subunit
MLDISLEDIPIWQIDLAWKPDTPAEIILQFKTSMTQAANGTLVAIDIGGTGDTTTTTRITNLLNKVFNIIILMTMFLCFFALSANMSANLIEQTKEIGVLRAIGFKK